MTHHRDNTKKKKTGRDSIEQRKGREGGKDGEREASLFSLLIFCFLLQVYKGI
jgi:hypothetical protein